MPIHYSDLQISKLHTDEINKLPAMQLRAPAICRKRIPGIRLANIEDSFTSGIWLQPLGSILGTTFSSVQDIGRPTLVVIGQGSSTDQAIEEPLYSILRQEIASLFHNKRVLGIPGELFSEVDLPQYGMSEALSRKMDIVTMRITTWIREDRR